MLWTGSCQFEIPGTQVLTYLAIAVCTLECVYVHDKKQINQIIDILKIFIFLIPA